MDAVRNEDHGVDFIVAHTSGSFVPAPCECVFASFALLLFIIITTGLHTTHQRCNKQVPFTEENISRRRHQYYTVVCKLLPEGYRIAGNTSIELLLQSPFNLTLNNAVYKVDPPESRKLPKNYY